MTKIRNQTIEKLRSTSKEEVDSVFNLIFNKYKNLVYYVSFDILKNSEDAKDIVNDTFLRMYDNRDKLISETKLKYFLLVSAKNLSINRYNENKNHLPYSDDVEGQTDDSHLSIYLEKFKDVLDAKEYRFLVLHIVYEFSFREIAKTYNLTTSQVSSKYQRGIKKLRDYYGGKL